jgi:hypothetical protein
VACSGEPRFASRLCLGVALAGGEIRPGAGPGRGATLCARMPVTGTYISPSVRAEVFTSGTVRFLPPLKPGFFERLVRKTRRGDDVF